MNFKTMPELGWEYGYPIMLLCAVTTVTFEDKGGKEEVFIHAERDMKTRIRYKESHHVGSDQEIMIGHDRSELVENNEKVRVKNNRQVKIDNNDKLVVGNELYIEAGTKITMKVGASTITMDTVSIEIKSPMITVEASATAKLTSPLTTALMLTPTGASARPRGCGSPR